MSHAREENSREERGVLKRRVLRNAPGRSQPVHRGKCASSTVASKSAGLFSCYAHAEEQNSRRIDFTLVNREENRSACRGEPACRATGDKHVVRFTGDSDRMSPERERQPSAAFHPRASGVCRHNAPQARHRRQCNMVPSIPSIDVIHAQREHALQQRFTLPSPLNL